MVIFVLLSCVMRLYVALRNASHQREEPVTTRLIAFLLKGNKRRHEL